MTPSQFSPRNIPISHPESGAVPHDSRISGQGDELSLRDVVATLLRRRWVFLFTTLVVFGLGATYTFLKRPIYEGVSQLVVSRPQQQMAGGGGTAEMQAITNLVGGHTTETQVEIVDSEGVMRDVAAKLTPQDWKKGFLGLPKFTLPQWTHAAEAKTDTDVITITTHTYDPNVSAKLANLIGEVYLRRDLEHNNQATTQAADYVKERRADIESQLQRQGVVLAAYQKSKGFLDQTIQGSAMYKELADAQILVDAIHGDVESGQKRVAALEEGIKNTGHEIRSRYTFEQTPEFLHSQTRLSDLNAKLRLDETEFTASAPEVAQDKADIATEQDNLKTITERAQTMEEKAVNPVYVQLLGEYELAKALLAGNVNRLTAAQNDLHLLQAELNGIPEKARGLIEQQMKFDVLKTTDDLLTREYYTLLIQEKQNLPNGQLYTPAIKPEKPSSPNIPIYLALSFVFGIVLATIATFSTERLDSRVHDPDTIDRITGLVPLAMIPKVVPNDKDSKFLVIGEVQPDHAFLESYRLLRHNIGFAAPDRQLRLISVTSASASEGKTTCMFNLAIVFAMDGKRVLIIDGDLRRPSLHNWTGLPRDVGLTSVVKGTSSLVDAIHPTHYDGVSCLTSGPLPPNPTEFLNTEHFQRVLKEAAELYDIVLVDAPPCAGMSDAVVISTQVDAMLLVTVLDDTQRHLLGATIRMLRQADAPLLGTVLNRMPQTRAGAYYYYYYYNYYYAYGGVNYGSEDGDTTAGNPGKSKRRRKRNQ